MFRRSSGRAEAAASTAPASVAASVAPQPKAPASFYCPISLELMIEPVIVATGHTYDRQCIDRWITHVRQRAEQSPTSLRTHATRAAAQRAARKPINGPPLLTS